MKIQIPQVDAVPAANRGQVRTGASGDREYIVKDGDSYWTIARDVLGDATRTQELMNLNDVSPDDLVSGQRIRLPASTVAPPAKTSFVSVDREIPGERYHTVEEGELLGDISRQYYGTTTKWGQIASANNISDPGRLRIGARLLIPQQDGEASTIAATTSSQPRREQPSGDGQWYTIQRGDILGRISSQFYGTSQKWQLIVAANPGLNPESLRSGQRIWIPGATGTLLRANRLSQH